MCAVAPASWVIFDPVLQVPTVAVEDVYIWNNTSLIQDEVLSQRLGLVPLRIDPAKIEYKLGEPKLTELRVNIASLRPPLQPLKNQPI